MRHLLRSLSCALIALVLCVLSLVALPSTAAAEQVGALLPGQSLAGDQSVVSDNGAYRLIVQGDGNVVLYGPAGPVWATGTRGLANPVLVLQGDGNLVLYGSGGAAWFSGTVGFAGAWLAVQGDGNLVQYTSAGPVWASSWHAVRGASRSTNFGSRGYCTWYAAERFRSFSALYPAAAGNAEYFDDSTRARGWHVQAAPTTQSVVVFERGVQGAGAVGHLAWVDFMSPRADGIYLHVWEMNYRGYGVVSERWVKHAAGMSYVTAPWA